MSIPSGWTSKARTCRRGESPCLLYTSNITLLAIEVEDIEQNQTIELIPTAEQDSSSAETDAMQRDPQPGEETAPVVELADSSAVEAEERAIPQEGRLTMLSAAIAGALLILLIGIFYICLLYTSRCV